MRRDSCRSGADDVEAADGLHLFALLLAGRLVLHDGLLERLGLRLLVAGLLLELEPREHLGVPAEDDVRPASGHVRGDGDGAFAARLRDDVRLFLVLLRVQDRVRHIFFDFRIRVAMAELFSTLVVPTRTGFPFSWYSMISLTSAVNFSRSRLVDEVLVVGPLEGPVRRDDDDVQLVGRVELLGLGVGRPRHSRELLVEPEEVLEGDGRHRAGLFPGSTRTFSTCLRPRRPGEARRSSAATGGARAR